MERLTCEPRAGWRAKVELQGLTWHTPGGVPYWAEGTYYRFDSDAIDLIERATNELHALCLQAVQQVIDKKRYAELHIPDAAVPLIESSWEKEPPSMYGRFDLAYDGEGPPKLLEYNADTPTALLEAAVIQWDWLKGSFPDADQFNSIHERLIALWKEMRPYLPPAGPKGQIVHFTSMDDREDGMTSAYLADTATQAAYGVRLLAIADVGWNDTSGEYRDLDDERISTLFKLYPWEWIMREPFGAHIAASGTVFIEPPWKMVLSNKGILPILWELFPDSPWLLPAYFGEPRGLSEWVRKPLLSREGQNVTVHARGGDSSTEGEYGEEGFVYQQLGPIPDFDGSRPVLGSWMIGQEAGGMGIRESDGWVTGNTSRFVPHLFK
jgi:glutathionylspermidine synthase